MAGPVGKHDHPLLRFFFDVAAWRGSRAVQRMSFAERGVYFEMLLEQWEKRNLPDDAQAVADAIASSDAQIAEVLAAWPIVRRKFLTSRGDETRIYNEALERTRRQQREYRRSKRDAGAKGGKAKAAKATKDMELLASSASPVLADAVAEPTEKRRVEESREEKSRGDQRGVEDLAALWNERTRPPLSAVTKITPKRRTHIAARLRERSSLEEWAAIIARVQASAFCRGESPNGDWVASFDWLVSSPDSAVKVLEGRYDDRRAGGRVSPPAARQTTAEHNADAWAQAEQLLHANEATREH